MLILGVQWISFKLPFEIEFPHARQFNADQFRCQLVDPRLTIIVRRMPMIDDKSNSISFGRFFPRCALKRHATTVFFPFDRGPRVDQAQSKTFFCMAKLSEVIDLDWKKCLKMKEYSESVRETCDFSFNQVAWPCRSFENTRIRRLRIEECFHSIRYTDAPPSVLLMVTDSLASFSIRLRCWSPSPYSSLSEYSWWVHAVSEHCALTFHLLRIFPNTRELQTRCVIHWHFERFFYPWNTLVWQGNWLFKSNHLGATFHVYPWSMLVGIRTWLTRSDLDRRTPRGYCFVWKSQSIEMRPTLVSSVLGIYNGCSLHI